jgi:hypothetical protein
MVIGSILLIVCFIILISSPILAWIYQTEFWRWAQNDTWTSTNGLILNHDKLEHFLGTALLVILLKLGGAKKNECFFVSIIASIVWEIKDAIVQWEVVGLYGGEGFSWKDLGADIAGILFAMGILLSASQIDKHRTCLHAKK